MVHLDIKPANIFVKRQPSSDHITYKLGDLGLVTLADTCGDVVEGDCRYLSKEVLHDDFRNLKQCDIFSLGATVYELCLQPGRPEGLPPNGDEWHEIRSGVLRGLDALPLPDTDGRGGATTRGGGEKQQNEGKSKPWLTHLKTMVVERASATVEVSADTSVGSSSKEQYAPSKSSTPTNSIADHNPTCPSLGHRLNQQFRQLLKSMLHPQVI
jgi:serine/threonine protein kinase